MTKKQILLIKQRISNVLSRNLGISPTKAIGILPVNIKALQGKLYEASVLASLCENLVIQEGLTLKLVKSTKIMLKQKGGPINPAYPHIEAYFGINLIGKIWTDIEFTGISYGIINGSAPIRPDYHELDIAFLNPTSTGRPSHEDVYIAIECKNTSIKKSIIREVLGFRRELSLLSGGNKTLFSKFPASIIPANPPSIHMLYCKHVKVLNYQANCSVFGIKVEHHVM